MFYLLRLLFAIVVYFIHRRRRLKAIHSRSDTNRTGAEALSFYYPRLLNCLNNNRLYILLMTNNKKLKYSFSFLLPQSMRFFLNSLKNEPVEKLSDNFSLYLRFVIRNRCFLITYKNYFCVSFLPFTTSLWNCNNIMAGAHLTIFFLKKFIFSLSLFNHMF